MKPKDIRYGRKLLRVSLLLLLQLIQLGLVASLDLLAKMEKVIANSTYTKHYARLFMCEPLL